MMNSNSAVLLSTALVTKWQQKIEAVGKLPIFKTFTMPMKIYRVGSTSLVLRFTVNIIQSEDETIL